MISTRIAAMFFIMSLSGLARADDRPPNVANIQKLFPSYILVQARGGYNRANFGCEGQGCTADESYSTSAYIGSTLIRNISSEYVKIVSTCPGNLNQPHADLLTPRGTDYEGDGESYVDNMHYDSSCRYKTLVLTKSAGIQFIRAKSAMIKKERSDSGARLKWYEGQCKIRGVCPTNEEYEKHFGLN